MNIAKLAVKGLAVGEHVGIIFEGREDTKVQMDKAACRLETRFVNWVYSRGTE